MARYSGPKNKLSRREGLDLFGKGNKLRRATQPPGQHGQKGARKQSDFGQQLREKQKTRRIYGIMERQFRKYFDTARSLKGATGENLLRLLETRLDNVVYRLGLAPSRAMARQMVNHGHIMVDGKKINIPSYQVKVGQTIGISPKMLSQPNIKAKIESADLQTPAWLTREGAVGKILSLPNRSLIDTPVNEQLIVEFYSR